MSNNTITENLQRLVTAKTDIKNAIITMGGGVEESHGLEEFSNDILTIPTGGGDIQFSNETLYVSNSAPSSGSLYMYNPVSCTFSNNGYFEIPIITTSSNVFIQFPIYISMSKSAYRASISYSLPSKFPSKYGYNANTMTLYYYYSFTYIYTGSCTVSSSKFDFYVNNTSSSPTNFEFGGFVLKFDKT